MAAERVAVVGTGIAGLSCAYLLSEQGYEVTLFERQDEIGMDSQSVVVENKRGELIKVNTPPRSFSESYYPNLVELYRCSGVEVEPWSWAWVAFFVGSRRPFISVDKKLTVLGFALPYVDLWRPLEAALLLRDGFRFSSLVARDCNTPALRELTLGEYVHYLGLSDTFVYGTLLPTLSMVCTCSYAACLAYPAGLVMDFYARTSTYGQFRTKYGTQDAVRKLTAGVARVEVGAKVLSVRRATGEHGPQVDYEHQSGSTKTETFDHVVLATQANHARTVLADLPQRDEELLASFEHETSQVVIHRDPRVMPSSEAHWAPMSVAVLPERDPQRGGAMFTIWMNDSFRDLKENLFQTWNPVVDVDPALVVDEVITFERPVMTSRSLEAVDALRDVQGEGGVWFCGAWNAKRIPLQESGVQSALEVVCALTGRAAPGRFADIKVDEAAIRARVAEQYEASAARRRLAALVAVAAAAAAALGAVAARRR